MKKEFVLRTLLVLVMVFSAFAIPPRWEYLGARKINKEFDKDNIYITASEGSFNALKIKVLHKPVTLYDMKVHYGNGRVQDIKVNPSFRADLFDIQQLKSRYPQDVPAEPKNDAKG